MEAKQFAEKPALRVKEPSAAEVENDFGALTARLKGRALSRQDHKPGHLRRGLKARPFKARS